MNSSFRGCLYLAACAMLWSTAGVLIKIIPWHSMVICSLRSGIAALILWVFLLKLGHPRPVVNRQTLTSGFFFGTTMALFVTANKLTTAANAIVLQSANPVFVILFSFLLFRQRFSRRDLAVVIIVMAGITLFFLEDMTPGGLTGNLLALLSAVTLSGGFISATRARSLADTMSGVLLGQFFSAALGAPFFFLDPPRFEPGAVGAILFLGVFQLGAAYVLFSYGARLCPPLALSMLGMLEPIFNPVWVAVFLDEVPGPLSLLGGATVIMTLCLWCVSNAKRAEAPSRSRSEITPAEKPKMPRSG